MHRILDDAIVQESTVKIIYNNSQGTGFFITEDVIVTAYHIFFGYVLGRNQVKIQLYDEVIISGELLSYSEEYDICLIKSSKKNSYLPVQSSRIRINYSWFSYGFPYEGESGIFKFKGTINQFRNGFKEDFIINSLGIEPGYDYEGLSGAPVICDNNVVGMILNQIDNKLGAISINKIQKYLKDKNVEVKDEETFTDAPKHFINDIRKSVPNYKIFNSIEKSIDFSGNWILLEGTPGSGKTLIAASYSPSKENISIIGKYFVKISNDNKPKSLRTSRSFLLKWLEEVFYNTLMNSPLPFESLDVEKRIQRLSDMFIDLNLHYSKRNQIGLIFLDGLDEIDELKEFLDIIPFTLPDNIKIILSCSSKEILPSNIKHNLSIEQIIKVTPIDSEQCERYISKQLNNKDITFSSIQSLAIKSEGHPLYLNYLINYLNNSESSDIQTIVNWIDTIPNILGDISIYYESIWDDFIEDNNKFWIVLVFSQLRQSINVSELNKMLPEQARLNFYQAFPMIAYLLKGSEDLELYHNSFKEFVIDKAPLLLKDCNDYIVKYCDDAKDEEYAIAHYVFHLTRSNSPDKAIESCNQEWADKLAIQSIEPDLVNSDIEDVIALSIEMENTCEVIRLLLLLQRIEFRYNYVFIEYAADIALTLIANKKFKQALRYIVRRNILLVDEDNAVRFLQLFYENQAYVEADILFKSIDRKFRNLIKDSDKGVSTDTFLTKGKSFVLASYENFDENYAEVLNYQAYLKQIHDNIVEQDGESDSTRSLNDIREYLASFNLAYQVRGYDMHFDPEKAVEYGIVLNDHWAKMIALSGIILLEELNKYNTNYFPLNDSENKIAKTVEYLILRYGYINDYNEIRILIKALIRESSNTDLVIELINKYLDSDEKDLEIRAKNKVDLNYTGYYNRCFLNTVKGYIGDGRFESGIDTDWKPPFWETSLVTIVEYIHYIEGKAYRIKSENKVDEFTIIEKDLESVINHINFSFHQRSTWNNSYQIPEEILSKVLPKLVRLLHEFYIDNLDKFLDSLKEKVSFQFGLYSEGFRNCIFEIIKQLILIDYDSSKVIPFVEFWENHIIHGVQNRWERTYQLLKISEVYSILGESQKSRGVFNEMLNTSMGPSWYKEGQFDLINSSMTYLKNEKGSLTKDIIDFAALLDFASGEMTFQRYIRFDKEGFIAALIANGENFKAIEYFKNEILPSAQNLLNDVEKTNFDCPTLGQGYHLGARNIVAKRAILNIVDNIKIKSPYLKWALFEIFIDSINDEDYFSIIDYSNFLSETINDISILNEHNLDNVVESICSTITGHNLSEENRSTLLNDLEKRILPKNIELLRKKLSDNNYTWELSKDVPIKKTNPNKNKLKEFNDGINKPGTNKNDLIKECIKAFEDEKISVWNNNWSYEASDARENLKAIFKNDKDILKNLEHSILNFNENSWLVTKELIWFLQDKLNHKDNSEIVNIVNEHFHFMVRPNQEVKRKYKWLKDDFDNIDPDIQIIDLLIWLLNHPYERNRWNTMTVLTKLCQYLPEITIPRLILTCINNYPLLSTESCSFIIKMASDNDPEIVKQVFIEHPSYVDLISKIQHLTILKNFLDVAKNIKAVGFNDLKTSLDSSINKEISSSADVILDSHIELCLIFDDLEDLNQLSLLNGEFCSRLIDNINSYCHPLSIEEFQRSDSYLKRSFHKDNSYKGRYYYLLKHSLNKAILNRINRSNIDQVFNILNKHV